MTEKEIEIVNRLGLHARAAAKLVNLASGFQSKIMLEKQGREINAKSIMGVMMLAAAKGSMVTVRATGVDEDEAVAAIAELVADKFGEGE